MTLQDAIHRLNRLLTVIDGSQKLIDALESGKEINEKKTMRAIILSNKVLAEEVKWLFEQFMQQNCGIGIESDEREDNEDDPDYMSRLFRQDN